MTQRQRIIEYMREKGEITQRDAIWLGCYRLAAQIFDLKKAGFEIGREMITVENKDGSHSRIASYSLLHPCPPKFAHERCPTMSCDKCWEMQWKREEKDDDRND